MTRAFENKSSALVFGDPASIKLARDPENKPDNIIKFLIAEFGGREVDGLGNAIILHKKSRRKKTKV